MSKNDKRLIRCRNNPAGVAFAHLVALVESLGFVHARTSGSHLIFVHARPEVPLLNLQPAGAMAKPYQVRQVLDLVDRYNLEVM